jgi:transcriptional regulator with XRE-family HTH domain
MSNEMSDKILAARLREVIERAGMTHKDVSRSLEMPYRTVQNYLAGENKIPATFMLAVCKLLGVESDYLVSLDFRPRFLDLHDAVIRALDEENLLPTKNTNDSAVLNQRAQLTSKISTMIWESYDRFRRNSLWKEK